MSQFVHVSQFLQSSLAFTIPMLITTQILALKYEMWEPLDRINQHDYEADERWRENEQQYRGSIGENQGEGSVPPNSVDRNIREELMTEQKEGENEVRENVEYEEKKEGIDDQLPPVTDEPQPSNPYSPDSALPQPNPRTSLSPSPSPQPQPLTIQIANQPSASTYPIQDKPYLKFYLQANLIFNQYIPIIMCCMTVAILVYSTYILSMFCFFGYLFVNLIFNYAKLFEKLATRVENPMTPQLISNLAGVFLIAFFIGIFIRTEFN